MSPSLSLLHDEKKFMWDSRSYATREEAARAGEAYQNDGFEILVTEDDGTFLVYTRRVVKNVAVIAP